MRKIRDVLRLSAAGMSKRKIAASLGVSATAAGEGIRRARRAGLTWPLPEGLTDEPLERRLFPPPTVAARDRRPQPNWVAVHRELRRPGVTLQLLWEEHRAVHPDGYGYSRYCELYRAWEARLSPTMRQSHIAGERLFVDYAGTTLEVVDASTGEVMTAQLFVAALGATLMPRRRGRRGCPTGSARTHAPLPSSAAFRRWWCPTICRSGITKACFYEPAVNRTYGEMAAHYNTAIVPARPYRARDKAKVEVAVQVATRFIIAKLRNRAFFSLAALNAAIAELVAQVNNRLSRHLGASRQALFEELERSALKPLPAEPYVFAEWKECRVGLDYHVEIEKHYYSVPHQLLREKVWARITGRTIEVFHRGKRVAAHMRSSSNRKHTTVREHMPSSHRRYADWTPERLRRQAGEIGRHTSALVEIILRERTHPEQGFRACVGMLRLAKTYGRERLEAACLRALEIGARSYSSVNSILKNDLDRRRPGTPADGPAIAYDNIRGPTYFH
jgi:transposase